MSAAEPLSIRIVKLAIWTIAGVAIVFVGARWLEQNRATVQIAIPAPAAKPGPPEQEIIARFARKKLGVKDVKIEFIAGPMPLPNTTGKLAKFGYLKRDKRYLVSRIKVHYTNFVDDPDSEEWRVITDSESVAMCEDWGEIESWMDHADRMKLEGPLK